jgi:putative endonuclease
MTNYAHGHEAEKYAAEYLKRQGYKILALNWRRPRAEIDIVARKKCGPVVFVEVKYRTSDKQGTGFDYITQHKLRQMEFAAEMWASEHKYEGEILLGAIEVSGAEREDISFLELEVSGY